VSAVVSIGTFDGVHRGHQHLLRALRERASRRGARAVVITFDPPPRMVLHPDPEYQLLTSLDERVALLGTHGADEVVVETFDAALAATAPEPFCRDLVSRTGMVEVVGGPDLALGHRRTGTPEVLRAIGRTLGFEVTLLEQFAQDGDPVRSGEIRRLLRAGEVAAAAELLGRAPTIQGVVVTGDQRGRTIGFPTANLEPAPERLVPGNGVFAVRADGR